MILIDTLDQVLILSIFAFSLNLLTGYGGQVSIAHGAFGAVGGFLAAYLALKHGWSFWPALLITIPAGCLLGALVGLPALMLGTEHVILLTLAVQTAAISVILSIPVLGGQYGLVGLPAPTLGSHSFLTPNQYLPLLSVIALLVFVICGGLGHSRFGRVLRGIREDDVAARSLGKNVFAYKVIIFSLTAGLAAMGGALYAYYNGIASPDLYGLNLSISIVVMVVVGGAGNLLGSLLGVVIVAGSTPFFEKVISLSPDNTSLVRVIAYGVVLIAILMVRPQGLLPEAVLTRRRSRRSEQAGEPRSPASVAVTGERLPAAEQTLNGTEPVAPGTCLVDVQGVSKSYGGIQAVRNLSLRLMAGRTTGLIGPNGAGKTTVFNLLTGAVKPDSGHVYLAGQDITGWSLNRVARTGMVRSFQHVRLFEGLTVMANVQMGAESEERAQAQLAEVGLADRANVIASDLSFGEQKLVALARILATDAKVLLLDEPTSGIDAAWVDRILEIIASLRRPDLALCIVEHNLHVVQRLADEVIFMENGEVTAQGTMDVLAADPRLTEAYFGAAH